jgi:hypothetical protein
MDAFCTREEDCSPCPAGEDQGGPWGSEPRWLSPKIVSVVGEKTSSSLGLGLTGAWIEKGER